MFGLNFCFKNKDSKEILFMILYCISMGRNCQEQARSGRPSYIKGDDIDQVIRNNPNPTVRELAETFYVRSNATDNARKMAR
ncbi:hypothetical protein TNCV_1335641 [Trichonephila clavipes]|nr:hypothetical protein TNCV_1335641 [Trichonephila clavipes]